MTGQSGRIWPDPTFRCRAVRQGLSAASFLPLGPRTPRPSLRLSVPAVPVRVTTVLSLRYPGRRQTDTLGPVISSRASAGQRSGGDRHYRYRYRTGTQHPRGFGQRRARCHDVVDDDEQRLGHPTAVPTARNPGRESSMIAPSLALQAMTQDERTVEVGHTIRGGQTRLIRHRPGRPQHRNHPRRHAGPTQHPGSAVCEPAHVVEPAPAHRGPGRGHRHENDRTVVCRHDPGRGHRAGKCRHKRTGSVQPASFLEGQQDLATRTVVNGTREARWPPPPRGGHLSRSGEECLTIDRSRTNRADR